MAVHPSIDSRGRDQVLHIARVCHEVNRGYCLAIGDHSQVPWEDAPAWQRDSVVNGVRLILANPATTPAESHQSWLNQKLAEGWTLGPTKDPAKREHPCMLPYGALPEAQRVKDYIFGAVVRALGL